MFSEKSFVKLAKAYRKRLEEVDVRYKCRLSKEYSQIKTNRKYHFYTEAITYYSTYVSRSISLALHRTGAINLIIPTMEECQRNEIVDALLFVLASQERSALIYVTTMSEGTWVATPGTAQQILDMLTSFSFFKMFSDGSIRLVGEKFLSYQVNMDFQTGEIRFESEQSFINDEVFTYHRFTRKSEIDSFIVENALRLRRVKKAIKDIRDFMENELKITPTLNLYYDVCGYHEWIFIQQHLEHRSEKENFTCSVLDEHYECDDLDELVHFMKESYRDFFQTYRLKYMMGLYTPPKDRY